MAVAPRGARRPRGASGRAAARGDARVFRRAVAQPDRASPAAAVGYGENATAGRSSQAHGPAGTSQGLGGMTDWLGMSVPPRTPRPELKGRVLARALARGRRWPLALAAALVVVAGGGGSLWWAHGRIDALGAERDRLAARVAALEDTVSSFIHDPATRLIQVPVSTGGRVGAVTIFVDSTRHRWPVRCEGLADRK